MSQLISSLYLEHKGLKKLLSLLQQKSDNLAQEKPIDFNLIEDVVMYIENFVDSYHHPKEDVIYQYIIDNNLDDSNEFQTKLNDHDDIKELTQHLKQVLHSISLDVIVSKESLNSQLKNFIYESNKHLDDEEHVTFPLLNAILNEEDWINISQLLPEYCEDPLFGRQIKEEYLELYNRLNELETC